MSEKRQHINSNHPILSVRRQCKLIGIHRSGIYYQPKEESELNMELMRLMDEHYLKHPYKGARAMHLWLTADKGFKVNRKRINRLYYSVMGLRSILPGPQTSKPGKGEDHQVFPYLLRGLKIERPNQVWAMDITYIPMPKGFLYLTAVIDLYSRFVVSWSISNTMDALWCKNTLEEGIERYGKPEILNTDQGSQFTSKEFVKCVTKDYGIKFSMDGKGRCIDNVFIERLWWSVKYEDAYIREYLDGSALHTGMKKYFNKYNWERRHMGIDDERPCDRYSPSKTSQNFCEEILEEKYLINLKSA
ncbi:IS3 family transposase [Aureispira anguillae]|uniref:IS3 family transposase n=1 Tax=Aureispira anguillae TaxID=2864201 RepID=A0A916DT12_9BACT|nr:IS3 family transposase [Aureispira anguillae]BDS11456.1 IS3 family transposase [Aureispira anguillae]BDS11495.1 IS3 family transposase [Aureispira anguillae]BDS11515.1 IS3 family transposase [Aureispira anguillae]